MFIVWGTKRVEKKQGKVADFCPVCRGLRSFELVRVGMASHIYYLSFGEGKLAGYLIRCTECGLSLGTDPARYATTEKGRVTDVEVLIQKTFPGLKTAHADRLRLEEQLKRTPAAVTPEQRQAFLMEPFGLVNHQVEARYANSSQLDKPSGLGCVATLLVGLGLFFGSLAFKGQTQDRILIAAAVLTGLGIIYTFVQLHLAPRRFVRRKILPVLARALEPLEPTQSEISECLEKCQMKGLKIGKAAKAQEIWQELRRRASGLVR